MHGGARAKTILLPHFSFRSDKASFDVCGYRRKANQTHQANIRRRVADNGIVEQGSVMAVFWWKVKLAPPWEVLIPGLCLVCAQLQAEFGLNALAATRRNAKPV